MNSFKISLKNNKKYFKLVFILLLLGFFIGFILYKKLDSKLMLDQVKVIENYLVTNRINFIFNHLFLLIISFIISWTIIGILIFPLNVIYEGASIMINLISFVQVFSLKGLLYGIIYNILTKGIYIIMLVFIFKKLVLFIKKFIGSKNKEEKKLLIIKNVKQFSLGVLIIFLNDVILYLLGNKILAFFLFIIK